MTTITTYSSRETSAIRQMGLGATALMLAALTLTLTVGAPAEMADRALAVRGTPMAGEAVVVQLPAIEVVGKRDLQTAAGQYIRSTDPV